MRWKSLKIIDVGQMEIQSSSKGRGSQGEKELGWRTSKIVPSFPSATQSLGSVSPSGCEGLFTLGFSSLDRNYPQTSRGDPHMGHRNGECDWERALDRFQNFQSPIVSSGKTSTKTNVLPAFPRARAQRGHQDGDGKMCFHLSKGRVEGWNPWAGGNQPQGKFYNRPSHAVREH